MVKGPPSPFDPATVLLPAGDLLYRVVTATHAATEFNPGIGAPTRFAFFGDPVVPVMYAADTEVAAVAETLLHDTPAGGGVLAYDQYARTVLVRLEVARELRVGQLAASPAASYSATVRWAEAAHAAGLDGLVWMSRMCNDAHAYVFFGDRCGDAFTQDPSHARIFASAADQMWLIDLCAPLHVDVFLQPL